MPRPAPPATPDIGNPPYPDGDHAALLSALYLRDEAFATYRSDPEILATAQSIGLTVAPYKTSADCASEHLIGFDLSWWPELTPAAAAAA